MRLAWDVTPLSVPMTGIGRYVRDGIVALAVERPEWNIRVLCVAEREGCNRAGAAFAAAPENVEFVAAVRNPAVLTRRFATRFPWPSVERFVGPVDAFVDSEWFRPTQRTGARLTVVHDLIPYRFPRWVDSRTRRAHLRAMGTIASRVDRVIVNSHATARDLEMHAGVAQERSTVVYPGVDPVFAAAEPRRPQAVENARYAIAVGTTTERKNLQLAIRALRLCAGDTADLQLAIVGASADDESSIRAIAADEGVSDRVHRLGYLTDQELAGCMAAAECLVFPSRFEGFGLPIIEAMSSGVPVIAGSDPSLDEASGAAALRVDPDDATGLAEAIGDAVDPAARPSLVARGRAHAALFSRSSTGAAAAIAVEAACGARGT